MLEAQRSCLKLHGHFQPATSLLPLALPFSLPCSLPFLGGYCIIPASNVQHNIATIQAKRAVLVQKRIMEIIQHRGRGGYSSVCLASGGLCSPRAKVTHFSLTHVTPAHPHDPCSIWINIALNISVAEVPAPLSTCRAAPSKTPCLPQAVSGESFCYGVVQCLAQTGLNSVLPSCKKALLTVTTIREASQKQKSPQEKTCSSGTGCTNQKCLETGQ